MKKSVLVLSEKDEGVESIESAYESTNEFKSNTVYQADKALQILLLNPIDLLVFNINEFTNEKLRSVLDLRMIGAEFPVLTLAKNTSEEAYKNVGRVENAILLTKPYENEQLLDLSRYLADGENVIQRIFQRFKTTEKSLIQAIGNNNLKEADLVNISKSGALLSFKGKNNFKKKQSICIQMNLTNIGKEHIMYGEIRWINENKIKGETQLGIMFISQEKALDEYSKSS